MASTDPLTPEEQQRLLASVGYLDETNPVDPPKVIEIVAPTSEVPTPPKKTRKSKKQQPEPAAEITATSPMLDNDWQNTQFQARKAIVGKGFTKEEAAEHNKKLWKALGDERMEHNKKVRTAQRALSGTGAMRDVILAEREHKESVDDLVHSLREAGVDPQQLAEALKRL